MQARNFLHSQHINNQSQKQTLHRKKCQTEQFSLKNFEKNVTLYNTHYHLIDICHPIVLYSARIVSMTCTRRNAQPLSHVILVVYGCKLH